jgi:hypothetical protein
VLLQELVRELFQVVPKKLRKELLKLVRAKELVPNLIWTKQAEAQGLGLVVRSNLGLLNQKPVRVVRPREWGQTSWVWMQASPS